MEPPFPPLPWGGECPNVVTFLPTEITAYAPDEVITRLLPENTSVSHPLCGPIFYEGQSGMASLTLLLDKTLVGPLYSTLRPAVQKSQQALSAGLLHTPISLRLRTAISRSFESGLEDTASAAALLPLMLVETPTTVCTVDSYQSVGTHGARP